MAEYKQVIILRQDLNMSTGKKVAQGCHAAVLAVEQARKLCPDALHAWAMSGMKKVALKVQSEEELRKLYHQALSMKFPCAIIQDAGLTELEPGTTTAIAIGPGITEQIDRITGALKLL